MESTAEFLATVARVRGCPRNWTDEEKAQIVSERSCTLSVSAVMSLGRQS